MLFWLCRRGFSKQVSIIVMVLMIAASMEVINATQVFDATIGKLAAKYKKITCI